MLSRMYRDHRFAQRRMSDALDEALTPRQQARFARHVADCPECGPLLRSLIRLRGVLRSIATPSVPPEHSVVPGVLQRLRDEPGPGSAPARGSP
ncbi:anti-sigma factor [Paraconexibacter sp.]|uniref:anti-sigma factor family protein n=1 Tax=Paraconexibacter sp. TaxID=2949640 RepID=UPI003566E91B